MKILKFLVIEDDPLLREVLRGALKEALRERERAAVIFEAFDPSEATRIVKQGPHIDLILLDLELPDTDGFEFMKDLEAIYALRLDGLEGHSGTRGPFGHLDLTLSWYPTVSLVVVSEQQDYDIFEHLVDCLFGRNTSRVALPDVRSTAFAAGAVGFIPKSSSRETVLDAFRRIFAGGIYFPEPIGWR
jgi:CheY-like chemotaxis protein